MSKFVSGKSPSTVIVAGPLHRPERRVRSSRPATSDAPPPVVVSVVEEPPVESVESVAPVEPSELVAPESVAPVEVSGALVASVAVVSVGEEVASESPSSPSPGRHPETLQSRAAIESTPMEEVVSKVRPVL